MVLMLGAMLKAVADPDHLIMETYATGVPLGLGVELPITPAVFPPKTKWSLGEQETWGGASARAQAYQ
eukprot:8742412-Lingulodinium_polyedra.AAC.1